MASTTKLGLGVLLILAATAALFVIGLPGTALPTSIAGVAALAMAAGALLVGTSEPGAGV